MVLVWAGMRGVVTLAAAQSLPSDTPRRSLLVLVAFVVAAGTLLVQGVTLPWVTRRLGLTGRSEDDGAALAELRAELARAALARLEDPRLRDLGTYPSATLQRALAELDAVQIGVELRT